MPRKKETKEEKNVIMRCYYKQSALEKERPHVDPTEDSAIEIDTYRVKMAIKDMNI